MILNPSKTLVIPRLRVAHLCLLKGHAMITNKIGSTADMEPAELVASLRDDQATGKYFTPMESEQQTRQTPGNRPSTSQGVLESNPLERLKQFRRDQQRSAGERFTISVEDARDVLKFREVHDRATAAGKVVEVI